MKGVENKENQRKYPLLPYIIAMFFVVVAIILISYFAQQRSNSQMMSGFAQRDTSRFETSFAGFNDLENTHAFPEQNSN